MMRILHIIPDLSKGGAERLVLDICSELFLRHNIEVRLVILKDNIDYSSENSNKFCKVIPTFFKPSITGKSTKSVDGLQEFIHEFKPDIIHSHLWEAEIVSRQIEYCKAKWFSHFHDNMIQLNKKLLPIKKQNITNYYERCLVLQKYSKLNNSFICISNDTQKYAQRVLPKKYHNNIHFLPNAISFQKFERKDLQKTSLPAKINLINIGSFVEKKNQLFLIELVSVLKNKGIDVCLHLIGDGVNRTKIEQRIGELKVQSEVILHGYIDNVETMLWQSSIYVHSAYYEPFGLVLLEAMAAGLPVVCLDGGGNRDIIENGKNGFMIKNADVEEFTDKIIELHTNKTLYDNISECAQRFAKKYDIKEYVDKLLEIYKEAPICK